MTEIGDLRMLVGVAGSATVADSSVLVDPAPLVLRLEPDSLAGVDDETVAAAATTLRRVPTVTVLIGDPDHVPVALAETADVCLSTVGEPTAPWVCAPVAPVADAVAAQPEAALALVALLRTGPPRTGWDGLAAEASTYGMLLGSRPFARWVVTSGTTTIRRSPDEAFVHVRRDGDDLFIEIDRPAARNALDVRLRDALVEAAALVAADPTITAAYLGGRGPSFSAGGDLAEFGLVGDGVESFAVRLTRHPGAAIDAVAERVTALVHGPCVGAGVEIPAFAHRVVADPHTTFRLPELSMGLIPGAGGTVSLPRRIGRQRTNWLVLTGTTIDAPTARDWDLVDELVPHDRWPRPSP